MDNPFFSVIIPVYNRESVIHRAVESVLNQNYDQFELIIVNDGSTDNSKKSIMSYCDTRINYVETKNLGVSHARNFGIRLSKGSHLAFLDSDDQWLPGKLGTDADFIMQHPQIKIHQSDEIWVRKGKRVNKKNFHKKISGDIFKESLFLCMISPSSVVIERSLFEKCGTFDERMKVCEDYDLWLRITCRYDVGLIDKEMIIKYGGHEDQLSHSVTAIDRFRIYSLIKLLNSDLLSDEQRILTQNSVLEKCRIVKNGADKRGRRTLAEKIESIISELESECVPQDVLYLLEE